MRRIPALLVCVLVLFVGTAHGETQGFRIGAKAAELGASFPTGSVIGRIRLLGMLELPAVNVAGTRLAELSDLAWDEDEQVLYAISDRGTLFWLRPVFANGLLSDVNVLRAFLLLEENSERLKSKRADSEGLDILYGENGKRGDTELIVSFERAPRIVSYRPNGHPLGEQRLPTALADRHAYRRENNGLEAVASVPALGIITAPEQPLTAEPAERNRLYHLAGRSWPYPIAANTGIVSMKWLEARKLLVLERTYNLMSGRLMAALRIADLPASGSKVETETVAVLDSHNGMLIDNFEGLTRHRGNRFFLVSDNNGMMFQRTLLLYFELLP